VVLGVVQMNIKNRIKAIAANETLGALFLVIAMFLILGIATDTFFTGQNLLNLFRQASFYMMIAVGTVIIMIAGGMDMSSGATMGMAGILAAMMAKDGVPLLGILLITMAVGAIIGAANGILIGGLGMPSFIATLGTKLIVRGLITVITGGYPINGLPESFTWIGTGRFLRIPIPIYVALAICLIAAYMLNYTIIGRRMYACGGNKMAAFVSGISVKKVQILAFICGGVLAALSGVVLTARVTSGQVALGEGYELDAIAGCVIGGASMGGGTGSVLGAVCGSLVIVTMKNGMDLMQVNAYWQNVAQGIIILLAVFIDITRKRVKN